MRRSRTGSLGASVGAASEGRPSPIPGRNQTDSVVAALAWQQPQSFVGLNDASPEWKSPKMSPPPQSRTNWMRPRRHSAQPQLPQRFQPSHQTSNNCDSRLGGTPKLPPLKSRQRKSFQRTWHGLEGAEPKLADKRSPRSLSPASDSNKSTTASIESNARRLTRTFSSEGEMPLPSSFVCSSSATSREPSCPRSPSPPSDGIQLSSSAPIRPTMLPPRQRRQSCPDHLITSNALGRLVLHAGTIPPLALSEEAVKRDEPRDHLDDHLDVQPPATTPAKSLSSALLARRRKVPLSVRTQKKQIKTLQEDEKIYDLYYWKEVLQEEGNGGKVVVCQPKVKSPFFDTDNMNYVMKIKSKTSLAFEGMLDHFRQVQVRMLNFPSHPGVITFHEVYEDDKFFYSVMEKAAGGSLFSGLLSQFKDGVIPQAMVKLVMRDILEAVDFIHNEGVLHRDIKPDNLVIQLYDDPSSPSGKSQRVMLIDFDHADLNYRANSMSERGSCYGTMRFNAPETFLGTYCRASDMYSIGCLFYLLMTGRMPYDDDIFHEDSSSQDPHGRDGWGLHVYNLMKTTAIDWKCNPWPEQPLAMIFCQQLLAFEPEERLASEALKHEWFTKDEPVP